VEHIPSNEKVYFNTKREAIQYLVLKVANRDTFFIKDLIRSVSRTGMLTVGFKEYYKIKKMK
jgi:hypothetical protein